MDHKNWPYNPFKKNKKGGGGKELKKRAVWWEVGCNERGDSLKRVMPPRGKKQRKPWSKP